MFPAELTLSQYLALAVAAAYLIFFILFCRLLLWKRYADRFYWRRRPAVALEDLRARATALGREIPFFSIMVPARNEADVIERTIDHLASLHYPPDRYEVVVVTDRKESIAAERARAMAVNQAVAFLQAAALPEDGGNRRPAGAERAAEPLLLALLTRLAIDGGDEIRRRYTGSAKPGMLAGLSRSAVRGLAAEAALRLWQGRGKSDRETVEVWLRRRTQPDAGGEPLVAAYADLLSYAIPAVAALAHLRSDPDRRRLLQRMAAHAAQAQQSLTREILCGMAEALAQDIVGRLQQVAHQPGPLRQMLEESFAEVCPTTQDIVSRKADQFAVRADRPRVRHLDVPVDFDGQLGGHCLGVEVPSTKGRALNWGLGFIHPATEWCGFYDAESRPDRGVLLYVAHRWLEDLAPEAPGHWRSPRVPRPVRIFQGPVFQVRNFYEMGPFCKIAAVYQAIAHDWYLPALFRRLPFVGGTNLFVEIGLLGQIGGYDHLTLTEDLELGTRAYLKSGVWPEYLPLPSSEQTPPTFRSFFRQRLRWATGHLQVMDKIRRDEVGDHSQRRRLLRELFRKGQLEWLFYQAATLVPPLALILYWSGRLDSSVLPPPIRVALNGMSLLYIVFTIYAFYRYSAHVDPASRPRRRAWGHAVALTHLLLLPLAAFLFPVPYSSALLLYSLGRAPTGWVKTPRTRE